MRLTLYTLIMSACIVIFFTVRAQSQIQSAQHKRAELLAIGEKIQHKIKSQELNRTIIETFHGKDPLYLHNRLESFIPLSKETEMLRARVKQMALPEDALFERRLSFLSSADNRFNFVEGSTELGSHYKEVVERQSKPVELDSDDLAHVFDLLEGSSEPSKPHLIVAEARLERKSGMTQEVWSSLFTVVRREYAP